MSDTDRASPSGAGLSPSVEPVPVSPLRASIPDADEYDDWHDDCCYECGGEGFVSDCVEEWACVDPEYGCDYCTRRCPLCNPAKPNPELQQVLADAIAQGIEAGTDETPQEARPEGQEPDPAGDAPNTAAPLTTKDLPHD